MFMAGQRDLLDSFIIVSTEFVCRQRTASASVGYDGKDGNRVKQPKVTTNSGWNFHLKK